MFTFLYFQIRLFCLLRWLSHTVEMSKQNTIVFSLKNNFNNFLTPIHLSLLSFRDLKHPSFLYSYQVFISLLYCIYILNNIVIKHVQTVATSSFLIYLHILLQLKIQSHWFIFFFFFLENAFIQLVVYSSKNIKSSISTQSNK